MSSTIEALTIPTQLASVRLAATGNQTGTYYNGPINNGVGATFTYASGVLTIDSVNVNLGDYIIFPFQTLAYENGIYQCTQIGAVGVPAILTRRGDFQCLEQISLGGYVNVYAGAALEGAIYTVIEPLPLAIGPPVVAGANNINFSNGPVGSSEEFLLASNNLSDVSNPATALASLNGVSLYGTAIEPSTYAYPVISKDITITAAELNTSPQYLLVSSGLHQYRITNVGIVSQPGGVNFSGGGGDRNIQVTDGTTVFGTLAAAVLQADMGQVNNFSTANLTGFPNTIPGASIVLEYQGGTTNYTTGTINLTIQAVPIA